MKENYKVVGKIEIKDGQGEVQGVYTEGFVYAFEKEKGDVYVEQGLAEATDHPVGSKPSAGASAPTVEEKVEAPIVEAPTVPTQEEENATIGIDPALAGGDTHVEVKHALYKIVGEGVELFGNTVEAGEEYEIAEEVGDALVAEGKAEKIEL